MNVDILLIIIEYIGVLSFAISGTIIALEKKTDIVGALVFALLTCFGGGIIRDMVLGNVPFILTSREYHHLAGLCIIVCLICFHLGFFTKIAEFINRHKHTFLIELTDAIGLASFCISGAEVAINCIEEPSKLVIIFCGCITGVGGGILRDICSAQIPFIFRKHIYLIPSLLGTLFFTFTYDKMSTFASIIVSLAIIIVLRVLAIVFKWNLPIPGKKTEEIRELELGGKK